MRGWIWAAAVALLLQATLFPGVAEAELLEKIEPGLRDQLLDAGPRDVFIVWVRFVREPSDRYPGGFAAYVERVTEVPRIEVRHTFERTHEMSLKAVPEAIFEIASFSFVTGIELVGGGCFPESPCEPPAPPPPWEDEVRRRGFHAVDLLIAYGISAALVLWSLGVGLLLHRERAR